MPKHFYVDYDKVWQVKAATGWADQLLRFDNSCLELASEQFGLEANAQAAAALLDEEAEELQTSYQYSSINPN